MRANKALILNRWEGEGTHSSQVDVPVSWWFPYPTSTMWQDFPHNPALIMCSFIVMFDHHQHMDGDTQHHSQSVTRLSPSMTIEQDSKSPVASVERPAACCVDLPEEKKNHILSANLHFRFALGGWGASPTLQKVSHPLRATRHIKRALGARSTARLPGPQSPTPQRLPAVPTSEEGFRNHCIKLLGKERKFKTARGRNSWYAAFYKNTNP